MKRKTNRLMLRASIMLALALVPLLAASADEKRKPLELVSSLDLDRYLGRWYEIARFQHVFEKNLVGTVAEYSRRKDGKIAVVNSGFFKTFDGKYKEAHAVAWLPNASRPAALKVSFFPLTSGNYLVFGLDDTDYQWALVGDDSRKYLWFLARTPEIPDELFERMKELAKAQGYDLTGLVKVPQKAR